MQLLLATVTSSSSLKNAQLLVCNLSPIISDAMGLIEIIETAFEHIQATYELQKFLTELKHDQDKDIVVPPKTSEGVCIPVL